MSENGYGQQAVIYVPLDVILDTRLAVIAKYDQSLASDILADGYHSRKEDSFKGLDKLTFSELYKNRDAGILPYSRITNAVKFIQRAVDELVKQSLTGPYHSSVKVLINAFPYELEDEVKKAIVDAMRQWLGELPQIEITYILPDLLTPDYIKQSFVMMFMYEFEQWLEIQGKAFEHTRVPEVTLFAPALYSKVPTPEELTAVIREAMHPMQATEMLLANYIELRLLPVSYFSVLNPTS